MKLKVLLAGILTLVASSNLLYACQMEGNGGENESRTPSLVIRVR